MGYSVAGKHVLVTGRVVGHRRRARRGLRGAPARPSASAPAGRTGCARCSRGSQAHAPDSRMWTVDLADLDGIDAFAAPGERRARRRRRAREQRRASRSAGVVTELDPATVEAVMAINYFSPVRLTLALLPELIERAGRIVNISSVAARLGPPSEAAYTASKAALTGWSESMQVDLAVAGTDVRVHVVNPGVIDTDLFHLPDNDESLADIEALPVEAMVEPVLEQLDAGTFEIYVPGWFADVVGGKFPDVGAFLAGSIAWVKQKQTATHP